MAKYLDKEMSFVSEERFICDVSKLKELFKTCMGLECCAKIETVEESFVGCALTIHWHCKDSHNGVWHSSEVYITNILVASLMLFSGNNFAKISLLAKCLNLAFFGKDSFQKYQKMYLAPVVNSFWKDT